MTDLKLSKQEQNAAHEFMNREGFIFKAPGTFFDDVCSEGIDNAEIVYKYIAERLEMMARSYNFLARDGRCFAKENACRCKI
jgi:hypothetical protein